MTDFFQTCAALANPVYRGAPKKLASCVASTVTLRSPKGFDETLDLEGYGSLEALLQDENYPTSFSPYADYKVVEGTGLAGLFLTDLSETNFDDEGFRNAYADIAGLDEETAWAAFLYILRNELWNPKVFFASR